MSNIGPKHFWTKGVDDKTKERVARMVKEGFDYVIIQERFGLERACITRIAKAAGIDPRTRH